jgi:hypothetical protein
MLSDLTHAQIGKTHGGEGTHATSVDDKSKSKTAVAIVSIAKLHPSLSMSFRLEGEHFTSSCECAAV